MLTPIELIKKNPHVYKLEPVSFDSYPNIEWKKLSERQIAKAKEDYDIFFKCQQAIYERNEIAVGDWVLLHNTIERVTIKTQNYFQVGGYFNSSYYISKNGHASYSGSCGDSYSLDDYDLIDTGTYKEGSCWHFHLGSQGANRGVNNILEFKLWILQKKNK